MPNLTVQIVISAVTHMSYRIFKFKYCTRILFTYISTSTHLHLHTSPPAQLVHLPLRYVLRLVRVPLYSVLVQWCFQPPQPPQTPITPPRSPIIWASATRQTGATPWSMRWTSVDLAASLETLSRVARSAASVTVSDGVHRVALVGAVGALIGQRCHLVLAVRLELGGGGVVLGGVEPLRPSW